MARPKRIIDLFECAAPRTRRHKWRDRHNANDNDRTAIERQSPGKLPSASTHPSTITGCSPRPSEDIWSCYAIVQTVEPAGTRSWQRYSANVRTEEQFSNTSISVHHPTSSIAGRQPAMPLPPSSFTQKIDLLRICGTEQPGEGGSGCSLLSQTNAMQRK